MKTLFSIAVAAFTITAAFAQDIVGTWQGTLRPPGRELRIVLKVARADGENLTAMFYSIDQNGRGLPASVSVQGTTFKATIPALGGNYEGKLSADGTTIQGTFTQRTPLPLSLGKATASTEWAIPEPPPPPRLMAADAKPSFEVATIKPSNPDTPGRALNIGRGGGNSFSTLNMTLFDLIKFAYRVHDRQVTGGPSWIESDKFDILAKPDTPGIPNAPQVRSMVQKLLLERFGLEFHREKKELPAYVVTVDKAGVKMTKAAEARSNLPAFGSQGPGGLRARNSTMIDFADFLQARILDRPVVDQTGLTDRYDFTLEWRPDSPALPQNIEDRPDLFTSIRQQLGLRIESSKAQVDVLVIDKVTRPTAN